MAKLRLTEEQKQYQQLARNFAQKEIAPKAAQCDHASEFPLDIYSKAWQTGLMNVLIPEQYGGLGLSLGDACLIAEEIGAACSGIGAAMHANNVAVLPIVLLGTEQQKNDFLTPLTEQLQFAVYCGLGSQNSIKYMADKNGAEYLLNGQANYVINASVAKWYLLLASDDVGKASAFIVPGDLSGIACGVKENVLGQKAADIKTVSFKDVKISRHNLIGNEGDGMALDADICTRVAPLLASMAVGVSRQALAYAIAYAKERTTFGVPIAKHQAVGLMLADMAKDTEAARLLVWQAAKLIDSDHDASQQACMAHFFAVDAAMRITTDAVQIFGGYGYSREYPVEKLMRDAKALQLIGKSSFAQRITIGKELICAS